jgi:Xaa-Pro dipeptidase
LPLSDSTGPVFRQRQARLAAWLAQAGVDVCIVDDFENQRTSTLRWLCGHPTDAMLFVFAKGKTVLVPWDVHVANQRSVVDQVIPYAEFKRSFRQAVIGVLEAEGLRKGAAAEAPRKVECVQRTSHLRRQELVTDLPGVEIVIREEGFESVIGRWRTIKDVSETAALLKAAEITNTIVDKVEKMLAAPGGADGLHELDVAQFLEREALSLGAEGMGFETLAAGPGRSWAIHPFPAFTSGPFAAPGLSILDFGVKVDGYSSDVTITVARGRLSAEQEQMIGLVAEAYDAALRAAQPHAVTRAPTAAVDALFDGAGWKMPHALGHGIGLDVHEAPLVRNPEDNKDHGTLLPGMVFTVEPGLYHPTHGGVRWENDVLMTEAGPQVLTMAKIIRME